MKTKDPSANELRLKIQREKKPEYRKKVRALKSKEIQLLPESSFSNKSHKVPKSKESCWYITQESQQTNWDCTESIQKI